MLTGSLAGKVSFTPSSSFSSTVGLGGSFMSSTASLALVVEPVGDRSCTCFFRFGGYSMARQESTFHACKLKWLSGKVKDAIGLTASAIGLQWAPKGARAGARV